MHPATSRNSGFTESADGLRYAEHMPLGQRVFVGVIGVAMFMIPVPFVVHAHWGLPWLQLLLVAVCVLAPSLLGCFCWVWRAAGRCACSSGRATRRCCTRPAGH